jgi:hypothetical protein
MFGLREESRRHAFRLDIVGATKTDRAIHAG